MFVGGTVLLNNTIVAGNYKGAAPSIKAGDILVNQGTVDPSSSSNMIGAGGAGGLKDRSVDPAHNNRVGVTNTGLGLLQDNGGPTQTVALLLGSPAHNAGSNALVPPGVSSDQRGLPRFGGGVTDIGAYESQDIPALLAANPLFPAKSAIVIIASPKNDLIVINAVKRKNRPLAIKRKQTNFEIDCNDQRRGARLVLPDQPRRIHRGGCGHQSREADGRPGRFSEDPRDRRPVCE